MSTNTSLQLQDAALLRSDLYLDGSWCAASDRFDVENPASGETIAAVASATAAHAQTAITAAAAALPAWRKRTATERSDLLRQWYLLVLEHLDDLALLLTTEQGKPLAEARAEIRYGASFIEWFAEEGKRTYGDVIPPLADDKRITVLKVPVGVVAAITPWNFPNAMVTRKVAPALAAGCTIILKPAEETPLSALALAVLAERAGIPGGVFNVLPTNDAAGVGAVLTQSPVVRKLSFTGSTAVGRKLMAQSADTLKKLSLELGGNAPFIVFADADITGAVAGAMKAKFRNAGQTCICANRLYVHTDVYDAFVVALRKAMRELTVGPGTATNTDIGPLINTAGREKVERLLTDATRKGAKIVMGGSRHPDGDLFFEPTLLTEATAEMALAEEEVFGPIAPVFRFTSEEEVIRLANATEYGLAAYFYGQSVARCWRVAEALEYGMVGINTGMISAAVAPFGGVKQSGFGREGSRYGIDEYLTLKYLCWGIE